MCPYSCSLPATNDPQSYKQVFCTQYINDLGYRLELKERSDQLPVQPFLVLSFYLLMSLPLPSLGSSSAKTREKWVKSPNNPLICQWQCTVFHNHVLLALKELKPLSVSLDFFTSFRSYFVLYLSLVISLEVIFH